MFFECQRGVLDQLRLLADAKRNSILIEGYSGSGKSYLAYQFSTMIPGSSFVTVDSSVNSVRDALALCYNTSSPVVMCIENLDSGVLGASYALLKFLEEPTSNIYVVVTCASVYGVPDTIVSRSALVTIAPPTTSDIELYCIEKDSSRFQYMKRQPIWNIVKNFRDVNLLFNLNNAQLDYIQSLVSVLDFSDKVTNIVWAIGHYEDNSETPLELVIRYLISMSSNSHIFSAGVDCLNALSQKRIGDHAILSKFVFESKYGE